MNAPGQAHRRDAITEYGLQHFRAAYPGEAITREDIFHYIYGLLHSEDYRERFRNNLAKELPRIPCVKPVADFRAFLDAGKRLGELHVGYESATPHPAEVDMGGQLPLMPPEDLYRVTKMRHPGTGKNKDRSTVIYNSHITVRGIPEAAWDYVVNGKPALSWVVERQCVKTDKASGIVSDANRYAIETVGDPRYPLDLLRRVTTVSLETMKIVRSLPKLVIDGDRRANTPATLPPSDAAEERRRRKLQAVINDITADGGGLRMADNLSRDELYDRARARAEAKAAAAGSNQDGKRR